ncbi:MAG: hypothetical protein HY852_13290 [Bradyrhizobium sp.]|uniref:hypothetical protein n=1 Tax=Bradyrhizobium sp. TaxID=376 RepID=UPI0025B9A1C4|nr:hypothetical protein [Bradyrhizobium sp.]MBI5262780.1 hypothetical protein [Bradyrhizobium sp.]
MDLGDIQTIEITAYPFFASVERAATIRSNFRRIGIGMSAAEVSAILGTPDEVRPLHEPRIRRPKTIGYSHWYVIRRMVGKGSANDKQESLVRIIYGLHDRVTAVDAWGL